MYCTTTEVYATAGMTATEVSAVNVAILIAGAEALVDRLTNTTYWSLEESGTADVATGDDELEDASKTWVVNAYADMYVEITSGTGSGQIRKILSNTDEVLTVEKDWITNPDITSVYKIYYTGREPYVSELRDGDDTNEIFTNNYPLYLLESASSNSTTLTPTSIYQYKDIGKLKLSSSSEASYWTSASSQLTTLNYYYGAIIPPEVKRYVMVVSALVTLMSQAGGTHNIPSTYSLPEGSLTIGQAYINIRGAWDMLNKEKVELEKVLVRYTSFA